MVLIFIRKSLKIKALKGKIMLGYAGIISGMSTALAILLTIIIIGLYRDLYSLYTSFKPAELKTTFYAFTSFLFAALILVTFNLTALILSMIYSYSQTEIAMFIHELSFIFYNICLAIGLALFIYTDLRFSFGWIKDRGLTTTVIFGLSTGLTYVTFIYVKLTALIVALESFILLVLYIWKIGKGKENRFFSGKLWALALILIFIGRLLCVTNLIYLSYLSIIYLDTFAFTALLLLHLEVGFKSREGEGEV